MKKLTCILLSIIVVLSLGIFLSACDDSDKQSSSHVHTFSDEFTCHNRKCTVCEKVVKATTEHIFSDNYSCHDRTCTVCKENVSATSEHITLAHDDCSEVNCLACGEVVKSKIEHTFGKLQTWKPATCTEDGFQGRECSVCGYKSYIKISHPGHEFDEDGNCINAGCNVTKEEYVHTAHCYSDNYNCHDRFCTVCGHLEKASAKHLALNGASCHNEFCFLCGEKISASTSHSLDSTYSCINRYCTTCNSVVLPTTEHSLDSNGQCVCGYKRILSDYIYEDVLGGVKITKYNGSDKKVIIPSTYNGKRVVAIGDGVFLNNKILEGVSIPDSIKSIGYKAFCNCVKLSQVSLSKYSSLNELSDNVFEGCSSLTYMYIPQLLKTISFESFKNCVKLNVVDFNEDLSKIEASAFSGCSSLRQVDLPKGLTKIAERAFNNCTSLIGVNFNTQCSVSSINKYTFFNCASLVKINIPSSVQYIGDEAFYNCNSMIEITIPESVVILSNTAFKDCIKLIQVKNYSGIDYDFDGENCEILTRSSQKSSYSLTYNDDGFVTVFNGGHDYILGYFGNETNIDLTQNYPNIYGIFDYAFFGSKIKEIMIPASLDTIGKCAFKNCINLNSVNFESGSVAKEICTEAFSGCSMLVSITIPKNIENIGDSAFFNCKRIVQIRNLSRVNINVNDNAEILTGENSNFTSSVQFDSLNNITKLIKQDRVYLLAYNGTKTALDLTGLGITDIASFAFEDNQTLNSIILPINLISIGECAFKYCKNLTSITLPDSVEEIGRYAFADCIELTTFTFGSNCQLQVISDGAFENCAKLSSIEIPKSVATVGVRAFYGCKELQSLTFESNSSLKDIQAYSFFNCAKLVSLNMPNTVETIGNYAFYGCVKISNLVFGTNFDSKIKIIGEYAFNGANLTSLDFGKYLELE